MNIIILDFEVLLAVNITQNSDTLCASWWKHTPPSSKYSCQKNPAWICSSLYLTTNAENRGLVQQPMRCSQQNPKSGNCRTNYPFFPQQINCKKRKKKEMETYRVKKMQTHFNQLPCVDFICSNSNTVLKKKEKRKERLWNRILDIY